MEPHPATILIVEDDRATRSFLADNLAADGHVVVAAECEAEAERLIASKFPDLAVIDLGLPDADGFALLTHVRDSDRVAGGADPDLPMLVLSGRAGELDRLRGFRRGCDDYLTKPFSYAELYARILALLRRSQRRSRPARTRVGPLVVDSLAKQAWLHGEPVHLSNKEFGLVLALASDPTRVFTREELLRSVWGFRTICATRTVDSHAHRLRHKLAVAGDHFVINVWGIGYKLVNGAVEP